MFPMERPISSFPVPPDWVQLAREIAAAHPSIASIQPEGETAVFLFDEDPAPIMDSVDGLIGKHAGTRPRYKLHASTKLIEQTAQITGQDWSEIGGVVTAFDFFGDPERLIGKITGQIRSDVGAELRMVQRVDSEEIQLVASPHSVPPTADTWENLNFSTSLDADPAPLPGSGLVTLEARLMGPGFASVRFVSASILGVI